MTAVEGFVSVVSGQGPTPQSWAQLARRRSRQNRSVPPGPADEEQKMEALREGKE
jgi:hypothetical protein